MKDVLTIFFLLHLCALPATAQSPRPTTVPEMTRLTDLSLMDAVGMALSQQPDVFIAEESANYQQGVSKQAGGEFDLTGTGSASVAHDPSSLRGVIPGGYDIFERVQDSSEVNLGLRNKLRTGQTLSVQVQGYRNDLTIANIRQTGPDNTGEVRFTLLQPLGKGRGREAADAGEESAKRLWEASLQNVRHVLSLKAAEAVQAYWTAVAAVRQLKVLEEAEERFRVSTEQISTLIAREELPASEISQAQANLADSRRARLNGEHTLVEAQQRLLLAMGISGRHLASAVVCRDDFPAVPDRKALQAFDPEALIRAAFNLRADYRAKEWIESANEVVLAGVKRNLAPQIDLKLQAGYAGYKDGSGAGSFGRGFLDNVPGASVSMQIVAEWPFNNSEWRGRFMQAQAQLEQARWEKEKLDRQIRSSMMISWSQLQSRMAVFEEARLAREKYESSLASEKRKYLLGMSTLINVLNVANQMTQAELNCIQAQMQLAQALISLRYESGTLVSQEGETAGVRAADLVTLPLEGMKTQSKPVGRKPPGKEPR